MAHSFAGFYRGKRVLVAGHTGFIGGWLVAWLKLLGAKALGYGLPPSARPNFFDATLLDRGITSVFADMRDRDTLANTFADFQPEIIFHAAQASPSCLDPVETFATNVMGTVNLLEEARLTGCVRAVVILGESQVASQPCNWQEKRAQASADLVRASHRAAELSALAFAEAFLRESHTGFAIAHLPSLIGGGDWSEARLVPAVLRSLCSGEPIVVRDGLVQWAHVLEAARAGLNLAENLYTSPLDNCGAWEFCSADHELVSEFEFATKFGKHWGGDVEIEVRKGEATAPLGAVKTSKEKIYPGWTSALRLEEAVAWTVDWNKAFDSDPATAWRTTEAQIEEYAKLPLCQLAIPAATKP
jgi:CDP-glucose 4,6-dehydratase